MEVVNTEMYHYHKIGIFDKFYEIGNEFIVDRTFQTNYANIINQFSTRVLCNDGQYCSFANVMDRYLDQEGFANLDSSLVEEMLKTSIHIIRGMNIYNREVALERYRLENCPSLPSRLHSIWLTNQESLSFWKDALGGKEKLLLFKVIVTGTLFQSSDSFIPDNYLTVQEMYQASANYWNPNFQNEEERTCSEFLFQGKVKILERLCMHDIL